MTSIISLENVKQRFRMGFWMKSVEVLHGISFTVPTGSIFGFLGANGAGKTTLIHLICGLRQPTEGRVRIQDNLATSLKAKSMLGYVPERPYFYDFLTADQLLRYFGQLGAMSPKLVSERIPIVLDQVGLSHARKLELRKFSKGMLQRVGIAQALLHDPMLLVLDEPMSGLDPVGRKEIRELIVQLSSQGKTVFFSSHVIPDIEAVCDQVAIIKRGHVEKCGSIHELLKGYVTRIEMAWSGSEQVDPMTWGSLCPQFEWIRKNSDGIRATLKRSDDLQAFLAELLKRGALIQWISPVRPTLEVLFDRAERVEQL